MLANKFETTLILCGCGIFQPEQAIRLQIACEPSSFDRSQAMMHIVQQFDVWSVRRAQSLEQLWCGIQIAWRRPHSLCGQRTLSGLVDRFALRDTVIFLQARNATLRAHGAKAFLDVATDFVRCLPNV